MQELNVLMPETVIKWRAYELRPDPVPALDPKGAYLADIWRDHVYPMAEKMKMPLQLPPIQPRTRLAHESAKWAESQGRFEDYNLALFQAFFEYGQDIGDVEVLKRIAKDLGLEEENLGLSLQNNEFNAQVLSDEGDAARIGVRAVPAFVADDQVIAAGVQTAARLQELLLRSENRLFSFM